MATATTTETGLANLAIGHLGTGKLITDLDTDDSQEARAARTFFADARDEVLRDFAWPFASRTVTLGLVASNPTTEWGFSYRYPSDCVFLRKIPSGIRNDSRQSRIPYLLAGDDTGQLIYTDQASATAVYTKRVETVSVWPSDFRLAFSYYLAFMIAPQLTKGDPGGTKQQMFAAYRALISKAAANAQNEQQDEEAPASQLVRIREGDNT